MLNIFERLGTPLPKDVTSLGLWRLSKDPKYAQRRTGRFPDAGGKSEDFTKLELNGAHAEI